MRNDYYVYVYVRLDNNSIFYVGKGIGVRMYRIEDYMRTNHFINILNKTPCAVYKLYDNLTEEDALFLERETIEDLVFNEGYGIDIEGYIEKEYNIRCSHASISANCRGKIKYCGINLNTNTSANLHFENVSFANND